MQRAKSVIGGIGVGGKVDETVGYGKYPVSSSLNLAKPGAKLSPLQFDRFIPWVCTQWCASTAVIVTRLNQEIYVKYDQKKTPTRPSRKPKPKVNVPSEESMISQTYSSSISVKLLKIQDKVVEIFAYYDAKQNLVEIAIIGNPIKISRKVIHAISLCIPYHALLNRFTFRQSGLTSELLYEINKLIPYSNITELCFDDSYVREGNYYILLEQFSELKYLSLNRCSINDDICKTLFKNLDFRAPSAKSLQIIELGSNGITDIGAQFIASVLKMNRCLLHINLSGNQITDQGFRAILNVLMEFPLTYEENIGMKRRKIRYLRNKTAVYQRCLDELRYGRLDEMDSSTGKKMLMTLKRMRRKSRKNVTEQSCEDLAEITARGIVGDFNDPYSADNVVPMMGILFAKGNLVLCSLNMAYNDLTFASLQKLSEVVAYQCKQDKSTTETGLIRVTLDGNYIPSYCLELDDIDAYLKNIVTCRMPAVRKTRTSSLLRKISARQSTTTTS